jgi:hypothetical protein
LVRLLLIKGEVGKSIVVESLLRDLNSIVYVYYEEPLPFNNYFISSYIFSIDELVDSIKIDTLDEKNKWFKYFIVYTNKEECDIKPIIDLVKDFESKGICRIGIITCR